MELILYTSIIILIAIYFYQRRLINILKSSRDSFKILVDSSPYSFLSTDETFNIKTLSKKIADLFSLNIRNIVNKNIKTFIDYDVFLEEELAKNDIYILKAYTKTSKIPLECTIYKSKDYINRYFWFIRDISQDLDFLHFFQKIIDFFPISFIKLDYKGKIINYNKKFYELFNPSFDKIKDITAFFYWNNFIKILNELSEKKSECYDIDYDDGTIKKNLTFHFFLSPLNESAIYCFIEDKSYTYELYHDLNDALEEQSKLCIEKDIFFAQMNHELRTPLNSLIGLIDYWSEVVGTNCVSNINVKEIFQDLKISANQLLSIVNEFVEFNKITSGNLSINEVVFNFNEIITFVNQYKSIAKQKGLDFIVNYHETYKEIFLKGDKVKINQILSNLISNSIKFTDKGSILVNFYFEVEELNEEKIYNLSIKVTDTGVGISDSEKHLLFKPFYQTKAGKTKGGTGLGLYITYELVKLMGGYITCTSTPNHGTTFTVKLKLKPVGEKEIDMDMKRNTSLETIKEFLPKEKVALIVDDVYMNRKVLKLMLEKMDWQVDEASSGYEALKLVDTKKYDVIFMDISMPGIDGIETLKRMREKMINTPTIACTAYAMTGDKEKFLQKGFDAYLSKPVTKEAIFQTFNELFKKKTQNISSPSQHNYSPQVEEIKILDKDALLATCESMEDLACELINELVNQCNEWEEKAVEVYNSKNFQQLRAILHQVRGTASTIHADLLHKKSLDLRQAIIDNNEAEIPDLFGEFIRALRLTKDYAIKLISEKLK